MATEVTFGLVTHLQVDQFSVPIMISNIDNIGAVSLSIAYSPLIKPISATPTEQYQGNFTFNPKAFDTYLMRLGWYGLPTAIAGKLCDLVFEVQPLFFHFATKDCEIANGGGEAVVTAYQDKVFDIKDNKSVVDLSISELLQ